MMRPTELYFNAFWAKNLASCSRFFSSCSRIGMQSRVGQSIGLQETKIIGQRNCLKISFKLSADSLRDIIA
jgi:hypothetical protein